MNGAFLSANWEPLFCHEVLLLSANCRVLKTQCLHIIPGKEIDYCPFHLNITKVGTYVGYLDGYIDTNVDYIKSMYR